MSFPPTLLLADDSVAIQRVVALTLAGEPVRLVVAKDGQDAINRMASERPDLVLADTNMPCVDGYEVARWVRQQPHLAGVPVLLLAGATDPVDEQRLHDSGANGVLEKPFEPSHVISRVKELLGIKGAPAPEPTRFIPPPNRPKGDGRPAAPEASRPAEWPPVPAPAIETPADGTTAPFAAADEPPEHPVVSIEEAFALAEERERRALNGAGDADLVPAQPGEGRVAEAVDGGESTGGSDDWFAATRGGDRAATDVGASASADRLPADPFEGRGRADRRPAAAADVFERLLAAEEQGDAAGLAAVAGPAATIDISEEAVEQLAGRVQARLSLAVQDAVSGEMRAAVAEATQAAVDGSLLGTVRGAVHEAVAGAVPAAVHQAVQDQVAALIGPAVRDAVEAALPGAVAAAVSAMVGSEVPALVRDTAERLVREEIARIRGLGA